MSSFIKASVLGLGLVAGAAFVAQAQTSDNTAALPPGGGVPSAVAPSGNYPGPALGAGTISGKPVMGGPVVASGQYPGPALGGGNGGMPPHFDSPNGYEQDRNMVPYGNGYGPRPN